MSTRQHPSPPPLQYNWHFCDWHLRQSSRRDGPLLDWPCITAWNVRDHRFGISRLYFSYHLALANGEHPSYRRADG